MATNRIPVGRNELGKAFRKHYQVGQDDDENPSHILLLFYAVECGLKSLYLRDKRFSTTEDITDIDLTNAGHNLMIWSKALKLPASLPGNKDINFRLRKDGKQWPISKAHQAWRYGALIDRDDEKRLVEWLKNVCEQLKEDGM